jgi:hypothetical protein
MQEEKLLVSWKGPLTKQNYFIGLLSKTQSVQGYTYRFMYNIKIVEEAKEEGFSPLVGLSDLHLNYQSSKMFSVFERRLPSPNRAIFKRIIEANKLEGSDSLVWDYLRVTKGKTATDNLSFLEPIYVEDGNLTYKGEIAGWSFTKDKNERLETGNRLRLLPDYDNPEDKIAVEVINPLDNYTKVGYIQKPYNLVFCNLLKKGYDFWGEVISMDNEEHRPVILIRERIKDEDLDENMKYLIHSTTSQ